MTDGPPVRDIAPAAVLGFVAVVLFVHTIRRLSTQDPPPPGESTLLGWMTMIANGAVIGLAISGVLDGAEGTEPAPVALLGIASLLGAALVSSAHLVRRRPVVTRSGS